MTAAFYAAQVSLFAAAPTIGAHGANDLSGSTIVMSPNTLVDGSAMIIGLAQFSSDPDQTFTIMDNVGNTYTEVVGPIRTTGANGNRACHIFVAKNIVTVAGALTITATSANGAVGTSGNFVEVRGAHLTSPVFATDSVADSGDTASHTAAVSLTTTTQHFTYSVMAMNSTSTFTQTAGFASLGGDFTATSRTAQYISSGSAITGGTLAWSGTARTAASCTVSIQPPAAASTGPAVNSLTQSGQGL